MSTKLATWAVGLGAAVTLAGFAAAGKTPAAQGRSQAGWYLEHAGQGMFQPCGQSQQWRVSGSAELRTKAKKFRMQPDTPVYVRLIGALSATGKNFNVSRVKQFGSSTPVRDCPMTGVVIPAPPTSTK